MIGSPAVTIFLFALLIAVLTEFYRYMNRFRDPDLQDDTSNELILDTRFVRSFIVTHTDFDGMASGALLLRHLGTSGILFSSPAQLLPTLTTAAQRLTGGDAIYIADLAAPPGQENRFTELLEDLKNRNPAGH